MSVILFWSGSLRSFRTSLPFNRVRLVHLALIFNRADSRLLDWKLLTTTFCRLTSSITWTNKFNERFFPAQVNSMFVNKLVKRKLSKGNKNLKFKSKWIFTFHSQAHWSVCQSSEYRLLRLAPRWTSSALSAGTFDRCLCRRDCLINWTCEQSANSRLCKTRVAILAPRTKQR